MSRLSALTAELLGGFKFIEIGFVVVDELKGVAGLKAGRAFLGRVKPLRHVATNGTAPSTHLALTSNRT